MSSYMVDMRMQLVRSYTSRNLSIADGMFHVMSSRNISCKIVGVYGFIALTCA